MQMRLSYLPAITRLLFLAVTNIYKTTGYFPNIGVYSLQLSVIHMMRNKSSNRAGHSICTIT